MNNRILFVSGFLESDGLLNNTMPFIDRQLESLIKANIDMVPLSLKVHESKLNYFKSIPCVKDIIKNQGISLIHAHYLYTAIPCIFHKKVPVIISLMGTDVLGDVGSTFKIRLKNIFSKFLAPILLPKCDAVIVKSKEMKKFVCHHNVHVIPNGVDFNKFKPMDITQARKNLHIKSDSHIILFAGDPDRPRKNYKLALQVYKKVRKKYHDVSLIPLKNIPHDDVPLYLSVSSCLLLTSFNEGSPNIVKESLACNTPVVSVDVGDVAERIQGLDMCAVCDFDASLLAKHIACVFDSPGRPDLREKIKDIDSMVIAEKIKNLYHSLLEKR